MIHSLLDFLHSLTNPERLIQLLSTLLTGWLGYAALFGLVFAETGMLVGFFLPGDSLLFTVGVVSGAGQLDIALVNVLLICAALLGDTSGYLLGRSSGPHIFNRPDSRIFRREHLRRTTNSTKSTAGPWSMRISSPSSGRLRLSSPAWAA